MIDLPPLKELVERRFQEISDGLMVTVYAASAGQTVQDVTTQISSVKSSQKSSQKIIELIRKNTNITIEELATELGISDRAVKKNLAKLKQQGTLKRIGPDKGGYWEIVAG